MAGRWITMGALLLLTSCATPSTPTTLLRPATVQGQACAHQCDRIRAACAGTPSPPAPASLGGGGDPRPSAASCSTSHADCVLACGGRLVGD
ncbi:hypothetical protein [Pseudoxanthomonas sp. JBR18]|uniref:hypothetical protein n=1 Tax=Pseudoxanthomonas sp. JBR18 TaxID=2969308 RepID=UPI002306204A|nr:hypothetical protein [Pseudoxanthomonas sp. JBR18]WCE03527.1 hypothetical protein PJ250_15720 [Pseudoxanthomonas sp. JBR18]